MVVNNEKDLADALKNNEDFIEIEGDLANETVKIKATGKVAWFVAVGAVTAALVFAFATIKGNEGSKPATAVGTVAFSAGAVSILGVSTTSTLISIGVAAGSVIAGRAILNKLYDYEIVSKSTNRVVLRRK